MPALWKSSERPMYVRTVWVDGFRHAILTHDDPYLSTYKQKKRPYSSASYGGKSNVDKLNSSKFRKTRLSQNEDQLGECLKKLNFEIKANRTPIKSRNKEEEVEQLNLTELDAESEDELVLKANAQKLNEFETSRSKFNSICEDTKMVRSNRTARTDNKENNDLSERVLQWLDLAGKINLIVTDEASRIAQPRHSCPEIQKKYSSTTQLVKAKTDVKVVKKVIDSPKDGAKDKERGAIDRYDFYTTANTIENYARQSRHITATRNVKKSSNQDTKTNVEQTRQKVANEIQAMEKQYADLINKKIIPNYNKQASKRQVHIFVPSVPKKSIASTTTSRTESLISQMI